MKKLILSLTLSLGLSVGAYGNTDSQEGTNVQKETIQKLAKEIRDLKAELALKSVMSLSSLLKPADVRRDCDEPDVDIDIDIDVGGDDYSSGGDYSCVPTCTHRNSSGECYIYGEDSCGYGSGDSYDHSDDYSCESTCTHRNSSGECYIYGGDTCGSGVTCTPQCTHRNSSGECYIYGEDICI